MRNGSRRVSDGWRCAERRVNCFLPVSFPFRVFRRCSFSAAASHRLLQSDCSGGSGRQHIYMYLPKKKLSKSQAGLMHIFIIYLTILEYRLHDTPSQPAYLTLYTGALYNIHSRFAASEKNRHEKKTKDTPQKEGFSYPKTIHFLPSQQLGRRSLVRLVSVLSPRLKLYRFLSLYAAQAIVSKYSDAGLTSARPSRERYLQYAPRNVAHSHRRQWRSRACFRLEVEPVSAGRNGLCCAWKRRHWTGSLP